MKWLTFAEAQHLDECGYSGAARYDIDWRTNAEEKFKRPIPGVYVYESGRIVLTRSAYRDPAWNYDLEQQLGIKFLNPKKDLPGIKLFTAAGRAIPKNDLGDTTHLLYLEKWGRLYLVNWRTPIVFLSPDAQPSIRHPIALKLRNAAAEKEYLKYLQPALDFGTVLNTLDPVAVKNNWTYKLTSRYVPSELESSESQDFCRWLARNPIRRVKLIRAACADKVETPYLVTM